LPRQDGYGVVAGAGAGAGVLREPKSTLGAFEIAASFSTVKFSFGL
jgi:hypothetical protein